MFRPRFHQHLALRSLSSALSSKHIDPSVYSRLKYIATRRGTLETCELLSSFTEAHMRALSSEQLLLYDRFLEESDVDIFRWLAGKSPVPPEFKDSEMFRLMQHHTTTFRQTAPRD